MFFQTSLAAFGMYMITILDDRVIEVRAPAEANGFFL
jgi:hypothetical protein